MSGDSKTKRWDLWLRTQQRKSVDISLLGLASLRFDLYWTPRSIIESAVLIAIALVLGAYL